MGFAAQDLSVLGYANGFTHWHYRSVAPLTDLLLPANFAWARELPRAVDQMTVNLVSPGRTDIASFAVVSLDQSGGVRLALLAASDPARPVLKVA